MMWDDPFGFGWGGWSWFWPLRFLIPLLFLALIVTVVVLLVRYATVSDNRLPNRRSPGLDALEERYARGEINRDDYLQMKRDITG